MTRTCVVCGAAFDAPTTRATHCSSACKMRAYRARKAGTVVPLVPSRPLTPPRSDPVEPDRVPAARSSNAAEALVLLADLGALGTPEGRALMTAAERLDSGEESGSGLAALLREYRAHLALVRSMFARPVGDLVDELTDRRAGRGA